MKSSDGCWVFICQLEAGGAGLANLKRGGSREKSIPFRLREIMLKNVQDKGAW
jgi:hypothetical protein